MCVDASEKPTTKSANSPWRLSMKREISRLLSLIPKRHTSPVKQMYLWLENSLSKPQHEIYSQTPSRQSRSVHPPPSLPTRILDLEKASLKVAPSVCLVEPEDGAVGHYLALSHRWVARPTVLLTSKTKTTFKNSISLSDLPEGFRDAISVTKQLGYRYLWIDSLCILQDSQDDWRKESARMADIYCNATCTIATHAARDDGESFFKAGSSFLSLAKNPRALSDFHLLVNQSNLSRRGWVFQERILSRRIFHFTSHGVFFEDTSGVMTTHRRKLVRPVGYQPLEESRLTLDDNLHSVTHWYRLMERYSGCELTWEIDRLPAVTGLAQIFGQRFDPGNFLYGLWSKSIHQGLLWAQIGIDPRRLGEADHRGDACPSWSWATSTGAVKYPPHLEACEPLLNLVETGGKSHDDDLDHFNSANTCIELKARVFFLWDAEVTFEATPKPRCKISSKTPRWSGYASFDGLDLGQVIFQQLALILVAVYTEVKPVYNEESDHVFRQRKTTYHFLILEAVEGKRGYYRRRGIGSTGSDIWWKDCPQKVGIHLT